MLPRVKILMILALVVMVSFACGKSTPKSTSTPAIDTAGTAAAQIAAEKATAKAQSALNDKATVDAQAAADAKATTDAKAALDAKATADKVAADKKATTDAQAALDTKATADAKATLDAQAALDAKATADAQATLDAKATQSAQATATQAAKAAAQQATQTAVAAKATQGAEALLSVVKEELAKIDMTTDVGKLGWMQTAPEVIKLDTAWEYDVIPFAKNLVASDFVLKTEVTWEAEGGLLICGLIFRSEADFITGNQYQLLYMRFSGLPGWDIESYKAGKFFSNVTGKIRFASAIKMDNGATNKFILIAEDNKFTVYINDQRIGSFYDDSKVRSDGRFAFYGTEEAGTSSCKFDNSWIWLLK
jgi:hypothetical protein